MVDCKKQVRKYKDRLQRIPSLVGKSLCKQDYYDKSNNRGVRKTLWLYRGRLLFH